MDAIFFRKIIILLLSILAINLSAQTPRINFRQVIKDTLTGSIVLSGGDSSMVYSRDFYISADSSLILYGDTLSTTATAFTGVATDLTLTGNGTAGNELKVDTAVIATIRAISDSLATLSFATNQDISDSLATLSFASLQDITDTLDLNSRDFITGLRLTDTLNTNSRGFLTQNQTITLSDDATGSGTTSISVTVVDDSHNHTISTLTGIQDSLNSKAALVHTHTISEVAFLQDSLDAKANDSDLNNYLLTANYIVDSTRINLTGDTAYYYQNGVLIGTGAIAGGGTTYNNISETADTVYISDYLDVDTSTLYVDATNNRVGIGTSSPFAKLDVLQINSNATKRSGASYGMFVENDVTNDDEASYQGYAYGTVLRYKGTAGTNHPRGVIGYNSSAFNSSTGTVDNMAGFYLDLRNVSSGTITNAYGARIIDFANSGGGTITNKYGFLTAISTSGATNAWNIYASGNAPSYFNGSVGIGTTSPSYKLDVNGKVKISDLTGTGGNAVYENGGVLGVASDARFKNYIGDIDNGIQKVLNLKPKYFVDNRNSTFQQLGFYAQEVKSVINEASYSIGNTDYLGINDRAIIAVTVKAIQEQQAIIESQATEIEQLKTQIQLILNEIEQIKNN